MITHAKVSELKQIDQLAVKVITHMMSLDIPQWTLAYPRYEHFEKDVLQNGLIIYKEKDTIVGCMAVLEENDPPYKTITSWQKEKSVVIHRVLVDPDMQKKGIAKQMLDYATNYAIKNNYESIKIDTHPDNYKMQAFLEKNGFIKGDYIEVMNRIAFEKVLEE